MEIYDIDLVRAVFTNELDDESFFISSFYESLEDPEALERYGKKVYELAKDQNKEAYKARGVVYQQGEADIVNIKSRYMSPFAYGVRLDVAIDDRDYVNAKLITLIEDIKGRKFDIIVGASGEKYVTKTPSFNTNATNYIYLDDNIFMVNDSEYATDLTYDVELASYFFTGETAKYTAPAGLANGVYEYVVYMEDGTTHKLYQATIQYTKAVGGVDDYQIADLDEIEASFTKHKVTLSINGLQKTEPFMTSGVKRIMMLLSGQATVTDEYVMLGNDIVETYIKVGSGSYYSVEPLEMPVGAKLGDTSNYYPSTTSPKGTAHNNTLENTLSFTFNIDKSNAMITSLYKMAINQSFNSPITNENVVFTILMYDYQFGVLIATTSKAKLDNVGLVNTPADILNLKVTYKLGAYS